MPKEVIKIEDGEPRAVVVGWQRGMQVQLATLKINSDQAEPPVPVEEGQYVDLDRLQINTLIRNLRHARDQAYGRDE